MKKSSDKALDKARSLIYAYFCGQAILAVAFILMPFTNKNIDLNKTPVVINGIIFWAAFLFSLVVLIIAVRTIKVKTKHYNYYDFVKSLRFPGFIGKSPFLITDVLLIIAAIAFIILLLYRMSVPAFICLAIMVFSIGMRILYGLLRIVNTKKRRV